MWAPCSLRTKDSPAGRLPRQEEIETLHWQGLLGLMHILPMPASPQQCCGRKHPEHVVLAERGMAGQGSAFSRLAI